MSEFKKYRRSAIAEMADWHPGFDMDRVSVSVADRENGSPKLGDKIARNPKDHSDKWLVAASYFTDYFEPADKTVAQVTDDWLHRAVRRSGKLVAKGVPVADDALPEPDRYHGYTAGRFAELQAELSTLRQQLADAVRDAERLRWIAAQCRSTAEHWGGRWSIVVEGPAPKRHDEEDAFYEAIDAAIAAGAQK